MKYGKIILICGLPGAGKTTLADKLAKQLPAVLMCPDREALKSGVSLFDEAVKSVIEKEQWKKALALSTRGKNVILDNGFWSRQERDKLREEARLFNLRIELIYLEASFDELWSRVQARNKRQNIPNAVISLAHMKQYAKLFQPPSHEELKLFDQ